MNTLFLALLIMLCGKAHLKREHERQKGRFQGLIIGALTFGGLMGRRLTDFVTQNDIIE